MNNQEGKYQQYSVEDFIWDEYFRNWVINPDPESNEFWSNWLLENDQFIGIVSEARQIVNAGRIKNVPLETNDINKSIARILQICDSAEYEKTNQKIKNAEPVSKHSILFYNIALRVAAVLILLAGFGTAIYLYQQEGAKDEIVSGFGNIKKIMLPDSSTIVLNGNSKISLGHNWNAGRPREIWLEGEAFFKVKHLNSGNKITPHERFLVHIKDVTVEVLGTSFDIRSRRNRTEIVLQTGKVKVTLADRKKSDIIMKEGDIISIDPASANYVVQSTVKPEQFSAWTEKKLDLTNAPLKEIIQYLEDNYGKKIIIQDSSLYQRRYQGMILLDNLDDALFVLSTVLNVHIVKQDNTILFMPK